MLQSNVILPSQYFAPRRKQAPEQRLMIAVLRDALDCVEKYRFATGRHGRRLFHEAKHWLFAEETDWPYSFECICGVLDLDANAVRQRLRVGPDQRTSPSAAPNGYCQLQRSNGTSIRGLEARRPRRTIGTRKEEAPCCTTPSSFSSLP